MGAEQEVFCMNCGKDTSAYYSCDILFKDSSVTEVNYMCPKCAYTERLDAFGRDNVLTTKLWLDTSIRSSRGYELDPMQVEILYQIDLLKEIVRTTVNQIYIDHLAPRYKAVSDGGMASCRFSNIELLMTTMAGRGLVTITDSSDNYISVIGCYPPGILDPKIGIQGLYGTAHDINNILSDFRIAYCKNSLNLEIDKEITIV